MADAAEHQGPADDPAEDPANTSADVAVGATGVPEAGRSRARSVPEGHLPVTEVTFDRAGAGSPFGDDVVFPLPVDELEYTHTTTP